MRIRFIIKTWLQRKSSLRKSVKILINRSWEMNFGKFLKSFSRWRHLWLINKYINSCLLSNENSYESLRLPLVVFSNLLDVKYSQETNSNLKGFTNTIRQRYDLFDDFSNLNFSNLEPFQSWHFKVVLPELKEGIMVKSRPGNET